MSEETLDDLSIGNIRLLQAKNGYRYSIDPVLLARFVGPRRNDHVVDLGTGCGILPLLLGRLYGVENLTGIEIQESLAERARRNVDLNNMADHVSIVKADVRAVKDLFPAGKVVDMVVSNPPFRRPESGHIAPNDERAGARHEIAGGIVDFTGAADWLLRHGGRLAIVYLAERLPELLAAMQSRRIEPKRLRMVHATAKHEARLVLVEGRKGGRPGLKVEQPLFIYRSGAGQNRGYSEEVLEMYSSVSGKAFTF